MVMRCTPRASNGPNPLGWCALQVFDEEEILEELPEAVRRDLVSSMTAGFIEEFSFFRGISEDILLQLHFSMRRMHLATETEVIKEGDEARDVYFLITGGERDTAFSLHFRCHSAKD